MALYIKYIGTIGYFVVRTRSNASSKVVSDQGMCMPCQLCLQNNTKMRHMYQMKEQPQLNAIYVWLTSEKPTIKEGDCLCVPCVKQIQRDYNTDLSSNTPLDPLRTVVTNS